MLLVGLYLKFSGLSYSIPITVYVYATYLFLFWILPSKLRIFSNHYKQHIRGCRGYVQAPATETSFLLFQLSFFVVTLINILISIQFEIFYLFIILVNTS